MFRAAAADGLGGGVAGRLAPLLSEVEPPLEVDAGGGSWTAIAHQVVLEGHLGVLGRLVVYVLEGLPRGVRPPRAALGHVGRRRRRRRRHPVGRLQRVRHVPRHLGACGRLQRVRDEPRHLGACIRLGDHNGGATGRRR